MDGTLEIVAGESSISSQPNEPDAEHLKLSPIQTPTQLTSQQQQQPQPDSSSNSPIIFDDPPIAWNQSLESIPNTSIATLDGDQTPGRRRSSVCSRDLAKRPRIIVRKFQKLDQSLLSSTPAPDVKIGQRIAYKEYYGNEFGTIRWIGRVPQICPDWTAGVEFDNAIGEGDGSLNGRRYFIAKDCFAKFLPLNAVALVDQHVGRPEPGTMISVMSAAVRPGQMISIQRVSTVHVQHCFLNAPHQIPGADILAVNTRLHCQCPNCGPCAHVIKPPRTQRLVGSGKNATHMCQFSTYTCCGMESQEEALCEYTGNKAASLPPPVSSSSAGLPPIGNSWFEGAGYLTNLQAQQSKLMPEEYKYGAAPEDINSLETKHSRSKSSSRRDGGKRNHNDHHIHRHESRLHHHKRKPTERSPEILSKNVPDFSSCGPLERPQHSGVQTSVSACQNTQLALVPSKQVTSNITSDDDCHEEDVHKPAKIVYRDSIENRYLFPTDEREESTIESDFEDLSQARYGSIRHHQSRNIFRSLRTLISCMSSRTDRSEYDDHSEKTFRVTGLPVDLANKSPPINIPKNYNTMSKLESCEELYKKEQQNIYQMPTNCSCQTKDNASQPRCHQSMGNPSISSDCGFSSASQNSTNLHSCQSSSPVMKADMNEHITNSIYQQIVCRLLNSSSITNEDLTNLKRVLMEANPEAASQIQKCLSITTQGDIGTDLAGSEITKVAHQYQSENGTLSDDLTCRVTRKNHSFIKRSHRGLEKDQCQELDGRPGSSDCCKNDSDSRQASQSAASIGLNNSPDTSNYCNRMRLESTTRSLRNVKSSDEDKSSLLKAFELKLTLSINPERQDQCPSMIQDVSLREPNQDSMDMTKDSYLNMSESTDCDDKTLKKITMVGLGSANTTSS